MKLKNLFIALIATAGLYACGSSEQAADTTSGESGTYAVATDSSNVSWKGSMVGMYSHYGDIKLKDGSISLADGKLSGGTFTIDLKSVNPLDSGYSAEHPKEGLIGHLSAPDFFATDTFPTANFVIKSVEGNTAIGDLTVRGKTSEEKVTDIVLDATENTVNATGKIVFNRQKYGVAWKATMKDMVLSDDIEISVSLKAKK